MNILERYVAHKAVRCPYCGSDDISAKDPESVEGDLMIRAEVRCYNCHAFWIDIHKLVSIEVTQGPKRDTLEDFIKLGYSFEMSPTAYGSHVYLCNYQGKLVCGGELSPDPDEKTYKLVRRCRQTMLDAALSDFYRRFSDLPNNNQQ